MYYVILNEHSNIVEVCVLASNASQDQKERGIFISNLPDVPYEIGKIAVPKYNPDTNEIFYELVDKPLSTEEQIALILSNSQSPTERYQKLNSIEATSIEELRKAKLSELSFLCTKAIHDGFYSESTGYTFGFNEHDQSNFSQQLLLIVGGINAGAEIKWKAIDSGVVSLTENEFQSVVNDAKNHKMAQQVKYWTLEAELLAATTKEAIDLINW